MIKKDIEIELKFPLKNPKEVIGFLDKYAKLISKNIFQRDTYFTPAHREFLNFKYPFEWLRFRESDKGNFLNYKHFYPENAEKTDYCDEFETKIDNLQAIKKIFESLNFKEAVIVEKSRNIWVFKDVEIAIDYVKGLGSFIELEAIRHFDEPKQGKQYLYKILKELNTDVGKEDIRGYPFKVLEKQSDKNEKQTNN